jgi:hypothetical protein
MATTGPTEGIGHTELALGGGSGSRLTRRRAVVLDRTMHQVVGLLAVQARRGSRIARTTAGLIYLSIPYRP